jgi:hypothetical protein
MLRDLHEDRQQGYFNLPPDIIWATPQFKLWVKKQIQAAREDFKLGKTYINSISNTRTRIAAYLYCARFEWLIHLIEKEDFTIRSHYKRGPQFWYTLHYFFVVVKIIFKFAK